GGGVGRDPVAIQHLLHRERGQGGSQRDLLQGERRPVSVVGGAVYVHHRYCGRLVTSARQPLAVGLDFLGIQRLAHDGEALEARDEIGVRELPHHPPAVGEPGGVDEVRIGGYVSARRTRRVQPRRDLGQERLDELEVVGGERAVTA